MKKILLLFITAFLGTETLVNAQNWQLVWADEFNGSISGDWVFETGRGSNGWGNNELQYYRRENASVQNGQLVITAKRENFGGAAYTSVRMKTQGKKSWKYGKMEARIAMPAFQGVWPAFWMLGDNISSVGWPSCGEIDVMEHINAEQRVYGTIHWSDQNNAYANYGGNTGTNVTGFHLYTVEWDANLIKWFVDGNKYHEVNIANGVNGTSEFHNNFFLLLNMAIGGNWPGFGVDNNALPANMYVDYVRVYQAVAGPSGVATVYKDCSFGGYAVGLPAGSYNLGQLQSRGILNDDISSLRVNAGYQIQLFEHDNFTGASITFSSDNSCLVANGWNDRASSAIVSQVSSFSRTIQAEQYSAMAGVQLENTTDAGGGQNVGWIDAGDWMAYNSINFPSSGTYKVEYRVASVGGGRLSLDLNAGAIQLGAVNIPATGGWQNWTTVSHNVNVNAGTYNVGIYAQTGGWNINWFRITKVSNGRKDQSAADDDMPVLTNYADFSELNLFPNPAEQFLTLSSSYNLSGATVSIYDAMGTMVYNDKTADGTIDVSDLKSGIYTIQVTTAEHQKISRRFMRQ